MQSVMGIALLVVGVVLIIFGMQPPLPWAPACRNSSPVPPVTGRFGSSSWGWSRLLLASACCSPAGAERDHDTPARPRLRWYITLYDRRQSRPEESPPFQGEYERAQETYPALREDRSP